MTYWVGTPASLVLHTIIFIGSLAVMPIFGLERVLLVLTSAVSLEAIYLSLFIQMTALRSHKKLADIEDDIDEILEDTVSLTEEQKQELKAKIKTKAG